MLRTQAVLGAAAMLMLTGPALAAFNVDGSDERDVRDRIRQDTDRKRRVAEGREWSEQALRPQAPTTQAEDVRATRFPSPPEPHSRTDSPAKSRQRFLEKLRRTPPRGQGPQPSPAAGAPPSRGSTKVPEGLGDIVPIRSSSQPASCVPRRNALGLSAVPTTVVGLAAAVVLGIIIAGVRSRSRTGQ